MASPASEIRFVDTTLRDGQESLWACGMRTGMILPIAARLDDAGFEAIEIIATTNFKKQIRELKENPWERIRLLAEKIRNTPLRAVRNRYMAAFQITPDSLSDLWLERMAANGVREVRLSDPSNNALYWEKISASANKVGLKTIINVIFSISPRHNEDYYAAKTRAAARLSPYRICFKDPGGLLTPEHIRKLIPPILQSSDGITAELHTHCNTGLGPLCALEAVKLGIASLNTALPPLANGASNPSLFNLTKNLRAMKYEPVVDEAVLEPVSKHFASIARRERLPVGVPLPYDEFHMAHQVPGGMISNFRYQLGKAGMAERLEQVLEEIGRVRAEFGYPIMVTPYSQFVGVQATTNVVLGERYREVSDEVIQYALGLWGEEEAASMDPNVRDKIVNRPRARDLAGRMTTEIPLAEIRRQLGGRGISDDELLLRYFSSEQDVAAMKAAGPTVFSKGDKQSIVAFLEFFRQRDNCSHLEIRNEDFFLSFGKREASVPRR
jgi:oxaloacetate decarboxylase alpha subunit